MQEKIIPCRWLLFLHRCKRDVSRENISVSVVGRGRRPASSTSKDMPTSEPPSSAEMTMDCAAALRHDCATASCNSPSASQGPGRTNANGTPAKKKKKGFLLPPALPLHHHPNKAVHRKSIRVGVDPRNVKRESESRTRSALLLILPKRTKDLRLRRPAGAEGVIAEDIERHKRLGYVPWDPTRSRV